MSHPHRTDLRRERPGRSRTPLVQAALVAAALALAPACERQSAGSATRPGEPTATPAPTTATTQRVNPDEPSAPGASRPVAGVGLVASCVTPYREDGCEPVVGFPAVSTDGARVAVIDRGPDSGWDGVLITVRVLPARGQGEAVAYPIVTRGDHERYADEEQGVFRPAFRPILAERVAPVEALIAAGGFRPLAKLGVVHADQATTEAGGLRAAYDGRTLTVTDVATGAALGTREIGPSRAWRPTASDPDRECGPFPVGELRVWASREPRVALVQIIYIGSDLCTTELPYLVL